MTDLPPIGNPARNALAVLSWTERDVLALHGVGPKAVHILREALAERGMGFAAD